MRRPRSTRYQPRFPAVVPVRGEGRSRVTHPFATLFPAEAGLTVRLACVRHAASVHPEPGSNSSFGRPSRAPKFQNKEKAIGMMVGTRDRVPHGIGLSSEISAGILAGGGPARVPIRFPRYPVFKVPGASLPPRPAASFRPRRKEIYYAHPLPRSRGFLAFFPGGSASGACFPHMTWGDALLLPFGPRTPSLHKPRKCAGRRERGISTREDGSRPNVPEPD